ncbi:hypothetical protein [Streptomyces sp. cg35]|uniref:hypothetical protein n=1 Tax=Streptomyces sp. cg35 TaxID=3421650 RepID=UPI003D185CB7
MPTTSPPQWQDRIRELATQAEELCRELERTPLADRLSSLAVLEAALDDVCARELARAAAQARAEGWPLRRIGRAARRSHEQIRILTATADADREAAAEPGL